MEEKGKLVEVLTIIKYKNQKDRNKNKSYEEIVEKCENGKCLLNAGITKMWNIIIGDDEAEYDNATSELGIGDNAGATWEASTEYSLGDVVEPTTPDGNVYECTTAGTSGGTEPSWVTGEGNTTTDNTVTWTCHTKEANAAQDDLIGDNTTWKAMAATYPQVSNQKVTFQAEFGSADANYAWEECGVRQTGANVLINRIVATKGTKTEGEVWTAKLEITMS